MGKERLGQLLLFMAAFIAIISATAAQGIVVLECYWYILLAHGII